MEGFDSLAAYHAMYRIRKIEEKIASEYPRGEMKLPVHLSIGQEAAPVGVCMALEGEDRVYSSHRSHAPYLAKGGDLQTLVAELYGKETGCTGGIGGSMYLTDPSVGFGGSFAVVGDCVSIACGAAFAQRFAGSNVATVAFFGDSVLETGQFWEALNFAALKKLPILFVCENNQYATQTHILDRQPSQWLASRIVPWLGAQSVLSVGGGHVEEVYRAAQNALGVLPAFIEVSTFRFVEHVGPNPDPFIPEEETRWHRTNNDPIKNAESHLRSEGYTEHNLKKVWSSVGAEIREAWEAV